MTDEISGYTTITYQGCVLEVPSFLVHLWPMDFPLDKWPTFCGPDEGVGDELVPDTFPGLHFASCCFVHDVDYATGPKTDEFFHVANKRLRNNMRAVVSGSASKLPLFMERTAMRDAGFIIAEDYFLAVELAGKEFFNPDPPGDPLTQPTVIAKIARMQGLYDSWKASQKEIEAPI
jgi:hypothetical protein